MKILLADDHAIVRRGLRQILADAFPEARFGEASTTPETLAALECEPWDVLVLDIFMPGRTGLEVLQAVRSHRPGLPVLVVSTAPEEQLAVRVLRGGAGGYLNKQAAPELLVQAIKHLRAGRKYVSPVLAERLATDLSREVRPGHERLSDREFAVLQLLLLGRTIKEIAAELSLSAKTVSTYHTRIWSKLGVHNDVELVHYATSQGLSGIRNGT
ncbi:MAG: response regulator transcription factor [Verrucomicrobia bacterium]|jgi:DNA-binding NarL/FixJ family response regulator|nr:response regulator transcription factor [Verrucomicrobiota bacterium]